MEFPAIEKPYWPGKSKVKRGYGHLMTISPCGHKDLHKILENLL
jgi:hypothetical protein